MTYIIFLTNGISKNYDNLFIIAFGYKSFTIIVSLDYQKEVLQCLRHSINSITVLWKLLFLSCTCLVNSDSKAI